MLHGKSALVTGSSSGIGLAAARAMLAAGARVALTSERPLAACPEVQATLAEYSGAVYVDSDLSHDGNAEQLIGRVWDTFSGIDILVNNVGTFREPDFLTLSRADFDRIFHLNVWSAIGVTQAVVRRAVAVGRGGRILFTSSLNGRRSEPGHTLYDASKGALDAIVRQLAVELAPLGFTTAAVAPGLVETPITDWGLRSDPAARAMVQSQIPIGRIATVDDVAGWFVFLASDAASYATGIVVPVCGGLDAQQMPSRPLTVAERTG